MKIHWQAMLLLAATLGAGCARQPGEILAPEDAGVQQEGVAITTVAAQSAEVPVLLEAIGEVQSVEAPTVGAEVTGRVIQIAVEVGDIVAAGDELGRLDDSGIRLELDAAKAERGRVDALARNQELEVKRLRDLASKSFIAASTIDAAEAQLRAIREQLKVAKAQVALVEFRLSKTVVKAPRPGKIDARFVSPGDYVRDGTPLFSIADTSALRLVMVFPEQAMVSLRKGMPLRVITAVDPLNPFTAEVTEIRPRLDTANKGAVAYADITDPGVTRAGASATVWATLEVHENSILVPQISLVQRPAGEVVYVIGTDQRAIERTVVSGARIDDKVEIVSGLAPGERIAVDGAGFLSDGVKVEVRS